MHVDTNLKLRRSWAEDLSFDSFWRHCLINSLQWSEVPGWKWGIKSSLAILYIAAWLFKFRYGGSVLSISNTVQPNDQISDFHPYGTFFIHFYICLEGQHILNFDALFCFHVYKQAHPKFAGSTYSCLSLGERLPWKLD